MNRIVAGACVALACMGARAADNGQLWEVTTRMNMAGMPAGMGNQTTRVCTEGGDAKKQAEHGVRKGCKMTDFKQSANRVTLTMTCPDGTAVIENVYNAAHTEYQGSMKMTMRDGNQMTMNMSGRKVGACDAQQAKREREEKVASVRRQSDEAQAQVAAIGEQQAQNCAKAPQAMDLSLLGMYGHCSAMGGNCEAMAKNESTRRTATACMSSRAQLCKRYQTMDGFLKSGGNEAIAKECGLDRNAIATSHCARAAKGENLAYVGRFCPEQAKPLAQQHCAGRSYTSAPQDKYSEFCSSYVARASLEDEPHRSAAQPAAAKAPQPQDAVKQGVTQGINKLKGLFGR